MLADEFQRFVATAWQHVRERNPDPMYGFFQDWALEEGELIEKTAGNYAMALQTFLIIVARFAQHPEAFEGIRDMVTTPLDLPAGAARLPGILDEGEWNRQVFICQHNLPNSAPR
jgi:hypothetical protein